MKKLMGFLCAVVLIFGLVSGAGAQVLTFDEHYNLGVTLGGDMCWNGTGGGHVYMEMYNTDDYIIFWDSATYVNSFEMNARPWEGYTWDNIVNGLVDIAAFDSSNNQVWSDTVNLSNYTDWSQWLTVSVETGNISQMIFYSPCNNYGNMMWPSIDNLTINESAVPEPATMLLLGSGLLGFAGLRRKFKKS